MDDTITTLQFELFPGRTLTLLPYRNVSNARECFEALRSGNLPGTGFINPAYVISELQLLAAANKTLYGHITGTMITKDLHTELIHNLSAQRNITTSLKEFGIRDNRPQFIVSIFDCDEAKLEKARQLVKGEAISLHSEDFKQLCDKELLIKHYKIESTELALNKLEESIISRIVIRDV